MTLSRSHVIAAVADLDPEPVRTHAVEVQGRVFPVKQVFEAATGVDRGDFISTTARRHLKALGFKLFRVTA